MHPNMVGPFISIAVLLLLFSRELSAYVWEKRLSARESSGWCSGRCGEFGWTVVRKDLESCHALCIKCGWLSHFDSKEWRQLSRR